MTHLGSRQIVDVQLEAADHRLTENNRFIARLHLIHQVNRKRIIKPRSNNLQPDTDKPPTVRVTYLLFRLLEERYGGVRICRK